MENIKENATEKKWYNVEVFSRFEKNMLENYIIRENLQTSISGCGIGWHYEILLDEEELKDINEYLAILSDFRQRY